LENVIEQLLHYADWVLGGSTILLKIFLIRKLWFAPIVGLIVQSIWICYSLVTNEYGLLLTPLVMTPFYAFNIKKWKAERFEHEFCCSHMKAYVEEEQSKHPDWRGC
jgi:hypothetical protein